MQISYSPVGSVDIWRPNRGLEQLVSAGIKSTILDFSVICQVYDPKEMMAAGPRDGSFGNSQSR